MDIKAVFFDIDNTLIDFDACVRSIMKAGFEHFGLPAYRDEMFAVFEEENKKLWSKIEDGSLSFQKLIECRWNIVFARLGIDFDGPIFETYFRARLKDTAILTDGAEELVKRLSQKYILCIASNGPYLQQTHRAKISGILPYFGYAFISEDIGAAKPSREFFKIAFERLNDGRKEPILPENTLMVGDSLTSDMAGGKTFGMKTCYYTRGADIRNAEFDLCIKNLSDLDI